MNDTYNQLIHLNKKLEKQQKDELLKLIENCKAELDVKKVENEIDYYIKNYEKLLKNKMNEN